MQHDTTARETMEMTTKSARDHLKEVGRALALEPDAVPSAASGPEAFAPPSVRAATPPLPSYVSPPADATRAGTEAASLLVQEYERVARNIQTIGEELRAGVEAHTAMITKYATALKDLESAAEAYRQEGKRIYDETQRLAALAESASHAAADMRGRINANTKD